MNISEIREKYPQYSDLSDKQVADGFHKKFYSDIPINDFYSKIGISSESPEVKPPEVNQQPGYIQDQANYIRGNFPPQIAEQMAANLERPAMPQGEGFSLQNLLQNIQPSAQNVGGQLVDAVSNPVETAKTLGKTLLGTGQLLYPGEQEYEKYPKALAAHYKGLLESPLKSIEEDPVGMGADVYGLLRGGVGVGKNTARMAANAIDPKRAANMYQRGAKFSTVMPDSQREAITKTALERGIMPNDKGVSKLNNMLSEYDFKVNKIIDDATAAGKMIDRDEIYRNLKGLTDDVGGVKFEGQADMAYVARKVKAFEDHMDKSYKTKITPREAQSLKQDFYERIKWKPGGKPISQIKEKLYRNLASGTKEAIEDIDPNISALNKEWGSLLDLRPNLAQAAGRMGNRDPFRFTDLAAASIGGGLGSMAGGATGSVAGALAGGSLLALRHPTTQARMGIALHALQNPKTGLLRPKARDALIGLLQSGNIDELINQADQE